MKRLTAIEKLARQICWAGFSRGGRQDKTANGYWRSIHEDARKSYIREAELWLWVWHNVKADICNDAALEYRAKRWIK